MEAQQKCSERGCAFPAARGGILCPHHLAMFDVSDDETLENDSLLSEMPGEVLLLAFQPKLGGGKRNGIDISPTCVVPEFEEGDNAGRPTQQVYVMGPQEAGIARWIEDKEKEQQQQKYESIFHNAATMNRYRKCIRLRQCVECGKPLNSNEKALECELCRKKSNRARRTVRKRRARAGTCVECGKRMESAVLPQRKTCEICRKGKNKKQRIRRRRLRGLPLGVLFNSKEVARIVGVHPCTVARWVRTKRIQSPAWHGKRGVRWTQEDLKALRRYKVKFYKKLRRKGFSRRTIRAKARKSERIRRRLRRSLGQCIQCGAKVETSGRCFCLKCRTNLNASRRARREAKFRNSRICPQCGKYPAVEGKSSCADCLQRSTERATLRYRLRKVAQVCTGCGKKTDTDMVLCSACSEKGKKYKKRHREEIRAKATEAVRIA
jgi:hypothetical protein